MSIDPGYVYILTNEAMPNLIKIGFTKRSPEERKRELSRATGVPIDFEIKYEIFTQNMHNLEYLVHDYLKNYRINKSKEFFKIDLYTGIEVLRNFGEELRLKFTSQMEGINETFEKYESLEILDEVKSLYPEMIRKEITSIRVYQTSLRCYLEVTEEEFIVKYEDRAIPLVNQKIQRQDLAFISGDDYDSILFNPENPVARNARCFLEEFDDYSKLVCCSEIFNDKGAEIIQENHFKNR